MVHFVWDLIVKDMKLLRKQSESKKKMMRKNEKVRRGGKVNGCITEQN